MYFIKSNKGLKSLGTLNCPFPNATSITTQCQLYPTQTYAQVANVIVMGNNECEEHFKAISQTKQNNR